MTKARARKQPADGTGRFGGVGGWVGGEGMRGDAAPVSQGTTRFRSRCWVGANQGGGVAIEIWEGVVALRSAGFDH